MSKVIPAANLTFCGFELTILVNLALRRSRPGIAAQASRILADPWGGLVHKEHLEHISTHKESIFFLMLKATTAL